MSAITKAEARKRSWETRRDRYGPRGHAKTYNRLLFCAHCYDMQKQLDAANAKLAQALTQNVSREKSAADEQETA